MLQAILDENNIVVSVNDWDPGVGTPCDEFTQPGMWWDGTKFTRHPNDIKKDLINAVQIHLDSTVQARGYDHIISCCSYKDSTVPTFATEATAAIAWRDAVWVYCNQVLTDYVNGQRPAPTEEELISELPTINW